MNQLKTNRLTTRDEPIENSRLTTRDEPIENQPFNYKG
jgi:hypothetical protein